MAISKVKLPNNTTQEVHDYRITGVDSSPIANSANVITSGGVYSALVDSLHVGTVIESNVNIQ